MLKRVGVLALTLAGGLAFLQPTPAQADDHWRRNEYRREFREDRREAWRANERREREWREHERRENRFNRGYYYNNRPGFSFYYGTTPNYYYGDTPGYYYGQQCPY